MSRARLVARRLHALDTDCGPLRRLPPWDGWRWVSASTTVGGGDLRRFSTPPHQAYGGTARPARRRQVCLLDQAGELWLHQDMPAHPAACLRAMPPERAARVGAVACLFPWSGRADLCARAGMPCGLGPALALKALPGGQAPHDQRVAPTSAGRRRRACGLTGAPGASPGGRARPRWMPGGADRPGAQRPDALTLRVGLDACSHASLAGERACWGRLAAPHPHRARTGAQPCAARLLRRTG
jgi:hypothetical protein